jgi:hypothetical protein
MTVADIVAHQQKHFGKVPESLLPAKVDQSRQIFATLPPTTRRMNKTEAEYGRILEAMQLRGEILWFAYEPITLRWGYDEKTGEFMRYKADFLYRAGAAQARSWRGSGAAGHRRN